MWSVTDGSWVIPRSGAMFTYSSTEKGRSQELKSKPRSKVYHSSLARTEHLPLIMERATCPSGSSINQYSR